VIEPRYRALVLMASFTGLRLGELRALTRRHLDLLHATVRVEEQLQELKDGTLVTGPPKTRAGVRTLSIPRVILPDLSAHLGRWAAPGRDGYIFCGTKDQPFRRASLYTAWKRAVRAVDIEGFRFHDLRHTANTLAATTGASTRELMARMGHASSQAALFYQHATRDRDEAIADALDDLITHATTACSASVTALRRPSARNSTA
jgi:integrase